MASTITSSSPSSASPSSITRFVSNSLLPGPGETFLPTMKRLKSLFSRTSADGFTTNLPSTLPMRTLAIGPLKGIFEIVRAAEAPSKAATTESFSLSAESTDATI